MIQNQIKEQSLKVKMCGMRRKEDIAYANEVKPDAIGYIFFSKSKRYVTGQQARELDQNLDQKILSVGVFVNETIEKVTEIANEVPLDVIQLHGDEDVIYIEQLRQQTDKEIWKAVRVKDTKDIKEAQQIPVDKRAVKKKGCDTVQKKIVKMQSKIKKLQKEQKNIRKEIKKENNKKERIPNDKNIF